MKQGTSFILLNLNLSAPLLTILCDKTGYRWKALVLRFGLRGFPRGQALLQLFELLVELATFRFHGLPEKNN